MIITSGYNVYPSRIENVLDAHELVHMSCVIGVPDPYKMQKVVAFVMLKPDVKISHDEAEKILMEYCSKHIAKYAMPAYIEFRDNLPKAKALAQYAEDEPKIGRVQLIRMDRDAAGRARFKRLDMSKGRIRQRVAHAISNDELDQIFNQDGIFE